MSANIYWEPAKRRQNDLPTGAPQHFMRVLRQLGWADDGNLDERALPGLRACFETSADEDFRKCVRILIEAIEKHGEIHIWAIY